jgi:acetyltransferase-like isoleucine patch superfamily enzyme
VLAALRRLRLAWWALALRARLRRHGVGLELRLGANVRVAGRPRLDVDPLGGARGGRLTLRVGADVRVGRDLVLDVRPGTDSVVEAGAGVTLQDHVRLQLRGGRIRLGEHAQVRDFCELKSAGELVLGERAICGRNVTLHCVESVTLADHVGLAERVTITDSDHANDGGDRWFMDQPLHVEPVLLEDNVFAATNAVILRGTTLRRNAVVAAGAVVTGGEYAAGWLVGGAPARAIKALEGGGDGDVTD